MPTPFEEVYKRFLKDKEDETFALMSDDAIQEKLFGYMEKCISLKFKQNKKKISDYDKLLQQFNIDLDTEEIGIIVIGMDAIYAEEQIERQIRLQTKLGISISNRDYKVTDNTPTIRELQEKKKEKDKEFKDAVITYSYNEFAGYK